MAEPAYVPVHTTDGRWRAAVRRAVLAYSVRSRRRKGDAIVAYMRSRGLRSTLLTGALGSVYEANESIVERAVVAASDWSVVCDVEAKPSPWPMTVADGRALPFAAGSVDLAVANAVVEHVGGEADQRRFVAEHVRVGRHWVITTPNRWFPVESHTSRVLRHWSPAWRAGRTEFTRLLSLREFRALLPTGARVVGRPWSATFTAYSD